jgi:hypothetical protein
MVKFSESVLPAAKTDREHGIPMSMHITKRSAVIVFMVFMEIPLSF